MQESFPLASTSWETRNLGVAAFALDEAFWEAPDFDRLAAALAHAERAAPIFVAARIDAKYVRYAEHLTRLGFYLVESAADMIAAADADALLVEFAAHPERFVPNRLAGAAIDIVILPHGPSPYTPIVAGLAAGAFAGDRFHRDFRCPPGVAERRSELWLADLESDESTYGMLLSARTVPVAFSFRRGDRFLLGAAGRGYAGKGLSQYLCLAMIRSARDEGYATVRTIVPDSPPALNFHVRAGFRFRRTLYTFHRWTAAVS